MRSLGVLAALALLVSGCGGSSKPADAPEPSSAGPTISQASACSLVEDEYRDGIAIMGKSKNDPDDAPVLRDYAKTLRDAEDRLASDDELAPHLEVVAQSMEDLAEVVQFGGTFEAADVKASATEIGTLCGWL